MILAYFTKKVFKDTKLMKWLPVALVIDSVENGSSVKEIYMRIGNNIQVKVVFGKQIATNVTECGG